MSRTRDKFNHWRARNDAVATDLAAALEQAELKLERRALAFESIADALEGGSANIATRIAELRNEAQMLRQLFD